jgi:two-component system, OmpR family, response regulator VicR
MPKTILIADDDRVLVRVLEEVIGNEGYCVVTAYDGAEALAKFERERPDLILLDIEMPKVHGYSLLFELRKLDGGYRIPVIVLTAHEDMQSIFMAEGVQEYLLKPCTSQAVLEKVRKYV